MKGAEYISCCILNGKEYVVFKDNHCGSGEMKITDGFHDKTVRVSDKGKMNGAMFVGPESINLKRIVKRMRGTRGWYPLLQALKEVETVCMN